MLRNKLRYLLLLASSALLLILYNKYYIGILFLTMMVMPFFLFGLLSYCYGKIRAELLSTTHVVEKGDKIPVTIQLSNPTIFPVSYIKLYLSYRNSYSGEIYKKTVCASLDYRTTTSVILTIASQYAGNLEITLEGVRVYDYMKLFSLKQKTSSQIKVAVLPLYYEIENMGDINVSSHRMESDSYSPVKKGDDPSEVFEIREYREGDRLQRIHWKLSRKQNQLMIKEFSDPVSCSVLLFVNLLIPEGQKQISFMDAMLECSLSLSYSFIMKGQMHYIAWYDLDHGECRRVRITQEKDMFDAVDGLLHAKPYTQTFDEVVAYQAQYPHDHYSDAIFISPEVPETVITSLAEMRADHKQMICIKNRKNNMESPDTLLQSIKNTGIGIWSVDASNLRSEMEELGSVL